MKYKNISKYLTKLFFLIILIALVIVIAVCYMNSKKKQENKNIIPDKNVSRGTLDDKQPLNLVCSVNSVSYVKNGECYAYIRNDKVNKYNIKVIITDIESGNLIYESKVLKPGEKVDKFDFNQQCKSGKHKANVQFVAIDSNLGKEIGSTNIIIDYMIE